MTRVRGLAAVALSLAVLALPASAGSGAAPRDDEGDRLAATKACADRNGYGPVEKAEAVPDGVGDWLVWVQDRDGDLWICNASAAGAVYANTLLEGDLLRGDGGEFLMSFEPADTRDDPAARAGRLCAAVGGVMEDVEIVATVADGMGDFLVWLKNADDALWLCNASADSKLYALEKVGAPLGAGSDADRGGENGGRGLAEAPRYVRI